MHGSVVDLQDESEQWTSGSYSSDERSGRESQVDPVEMKNGGFFIIAALTAYGGVSGVVNDSDLIDWTKVPQASKYYLAGNVDLGSCACDLTFGLCDANCCCDPDCSEKQFSRCLPENVAILDRPSDGYSTTEIPNTVTEVSMQGFTCPNSIFADPYSGYGWCLAFSNTASKGLFFPTTSQSSFYSDNSAFSNEYRLSKGYTFDAVSGGTHFPTAILSDSPYGFGSPMQVLIDSNTGTRGFWTLPAAMEESSECQISGLQGRMMVAKSSSCYTSWISSQQLISEYCKDSSVLSSAFFLSGYSFLRDPALKSSFKLKLGTIKCGPGVGPYGAGSSGGPCCLNEVTGALVSCNGNANSAVTAPIFTTNGYSGISASILPKPIATGNVCANVLESISFKLQIESFSGSFLVDSGTVDLSFASVDGDSAARIAQTFSFKYLNSTVGQVTKSRSGNPGYLTGRPVLLGQKVSQGTLNAIDSTTLTLASVNPKTKACTTSNDDLFRVPILFGLDTTTGCFLYLSHKDLTDNCNAIRSQIWDIQTGAVANLISHTAIMGNASYENINEWISVINEMPTNVGEPGSLTTTASSGSCPNLLVGMDIQFLVSNKGSLAKPQKIIVGARIVYQTGGFEYLCSSTICRTVAGSLVSEKAPFEIRSSVTFVSAVTGNTLSSYVPDPPTIIASLPNDIFYPFVINEATVNSP